MSCFDNKSKIPSSVVLPTLASWHQSTQQQSLKPYPVSQQENARHFVLHCTFAHLRYTLPQTPAQVCATAFLDACDSSSRSSLRATSAQTGARRTLPSSVI